MNGCLEAALAYAERGWYAFPLYELNGAGCACGNPACKNPAKHPRTAHGFKDGSTDVTAIRRWWKYWVSANVGIACGPSALVVLDVDPRHGGDASFEALRAALGASTFDTLTHQTGGGGTHYIFRAPCDLVERIGSHENGLGADYPGIDVKAGGGYIVAPPSRHISGAQYTKELSSPAQPAELPERLAAMLLANRGRKPIAGADNHERIPHGRRHKELLRLAGRLRRTGMNGPAIADALLATNARQCDPPLDDHEVIDLGHDTGRRYQPVATDAMNRQPPRFVRVGDLLAESDESDDVRFVVDGLLVEGGTAILAGRPKGGKSTLAQNLALAVERGEPFLGRKTRKGPVLYLALEGARGVWRGSFRKLGAGADDDLHICIERAPEGALQWLRDAIVEYSPVLVIVDTLQRLLRVRDSNDYAQGSNVFDSVIELARTSGATLLFVHHSGKTHFQEVVDEVMGSTAWAAGVDTVLVVRRSERYRTVASSQRCGEELEETVLNFDKETLRVSVAGSKAEADLSAMKTRVLDAVQQLLGEHSEQYPDTAAILAAVEGRRSLKLDALKSAVATGDLVIQSGAGKKGDPCRYGFGSAVPDYTQEPQDRSEQNTENARGVGINTVPVDSTAFDGSGNRIDEAGSGGEGRSPCAFHCGSTHEPCSRCAASFAEHHQGFGHEPGQSSKTFWDAAESQRRGGSSGSPNVAS